MAGAGTIGASLNVRSRNVAARLFNNRRLLEPIGHIPPAEAEERCYAQPEATALAA